MDRNVNVIDWLFDNDLCLYDYIVDLLKLSVLCGFVSECRCRCILVGADFCFRISDEVKLNKMSFCNREYSKYTQREFNRFGIPNVRVSNNVFFTDF
jgi:hypothetical protein